MNFCFIKFFCFINVLYFVWKICQNRLKLLQAKVMFIHSNDGAYPTNVLILNWGVWHPNPNGGGGWFRKIERKKMQNWFNANGGRYTKKTMTMFQFYWFFKFFANKELCKFCNFWYSLFNEVWCKFLQKSDSTYYLKSSKNTYFGSISIFST